jgi:hypothetical protein
VAVAHQTHEAVVEQHLAAQLVGCAVDPECEIERVGLQAAEDRVGEGENLQRHVRRDRGRARHEAGEDHAGGVVGGGDPEGVGRGRGIEVGAAQQAFQRRQQALDLGVEVHGPQRRLVALPGAHQQFVVEQLLQPVEGPAHGGLAQIHALGRAGDAALLDQRLQRGEEAKIDLTHMCLAHAKDYNNALDL